LNGWLSNRFLGGTANEFVIPVSPSAPDTFAPVL